MRNSLLALALLALLPATPVAAQQPSDTSLTVESIFKRGDFRSAPLPSVHWLKDGKSYLDTRPNTSGGADIVRVDLSTGTERVVVDAKTIVDAAGKRIDIEDITLSDDESKALLFHGSVRVWRQNTRGIFSVLDFATGKVISIVRVESSVDTLVRRNVTHPNDTTTAPALGKSPSFIAPPVRTGLQMFAKFSPDGRQVFLYDRSGRQLRQVTTDGMDVLSVAAVDEVRGQVYVIAAAPNPTQRQLYVASYKKNEMRRLTQDAGSHAPTIGPGARWAVDVYSTIASPATATVYELPAWTKRRTITDNAALKAKIAALGPRAEFFRLPMSDGTQLDAFRIVPASFDSTKKYPVLMYVYGGPAAPTVNDSWGGTRELWHMLLAQRGYVVVSVDNRGAAWRGRAFRKITQYHLGRHESSDQIEAAKWLGRRSWVDASRIGIWGWSYGGYMTALTTALGGDVFRMGIAVAPVTDWRNYDTIYTERLMWTPQDNKAGYDESAPQNHVAGLKARLLVVHGTGDDNVHPQNTIQFADKLEAAGKPFWMLLYPNRTHSISGGNTQTHLFDSLTRFVTENL